MIRHTFRITKPRANLRYESMRIIQQVKAILPSARIEEVGSTAIKGLIGKNDIDIAIAVVASDFVAARTSLDQLFRRNGEQFSSDVFQGYVTRSISESALQLFCIDSAFDVFSDFRNLILASASLRMRYVSLKRNWHGRDMDSYRAAKSRFIQTVLAK